MTKHSNRKNVQKEISSQIKGDFQKETIAKSKNVKSQKRSASDDGSVVYPVAKKQKVLAGEDEKSSSSNPKLVISQVEHFNDVKELEKKDFCPFRFVPTSNESFKEWTLQMNHLVYFYCNFNANKYNKSLQEQVKVLNINSNLSCFQVISGTYQGVKFQIVFSWQKYQTEKYKIVLYTETANELNQEQLLKCLFSFNVLFFSPHSYDHPDYFTF
jgi:hypothetical protein